MELAKYLKESTVLLAPRGKTKEDLLGEMVEAACAEEAGWDAPSILSKALEREWARSTGFGKGLAVAHARVEKCRAIQVVVARPRSPVDWSAVDKQPVEFVVLVVGDESQEALYLQILSEISKIWARQASRALLLSVQNADDLIRLILEARTRTHPR